MRKLTLRRKKTFVASLVKIKIFFEHPQGELELGSIRCREVGSLKNGAAVEYNIPNGYFYIFIVYDKLIPSLGHAYYRIPAGDEDVELYTAPVVDIITGFGIYTKEDLIRLNIADGW